MSKKILVIGGGKWQVPIIQKIKQMGYYTICSNLYEDSIGFEYADESFVADVLDKEANLQIAKSSKVDAVVTDQSDIAVNTVAYISEKLGLNGVGIDVASLYTNKLRMREELNVDNLYHPKYKICKNIGEAVEFFETCGTDIIIKPLANQSSRGVYKITSVDELKEKFDDTMGSSVDRKILVEEYIGGFEITVEGFKCEDRHYTLAISKKVHYEKLPTVAKSLTYLDKFDEFETSQIESINDNLFNRLKFGITHVEYKYYNNKFYLIEAAIRGGGTKISSHIIPLVSGVDVNELLIKSLLTYDDIKVEPKKKKNCVILKFFDFETGKVAKINGIEFLKETKSIIDFDFEFKLGDTIQNINDDRSRIGYFIACANNKDELDKVVSEVDEKVYIEYE